MYKVIGPETPRNRGRIDSDAFKTVKLRKPQATSDSRPCCLDARLKLNASKEIVRTAGKHDEIAWDEAELTMRLSENHLRACRKRAAKARK